MLTIPLVLTVLAACGPTITDVRVYPPGSPAPAGNGPHVEMHYLGNGGWLIRRGADAVATAPFVSNPVGAAIYLPAEPRLARIDARVPAMPAVHIVLVGHGHYDHAMDLPHIMKTKVPPEARLYGSKTVKHLLGRTVGRDPRGNDRVVDVSGQAADGMAAGAWLPPGHGPVRFMPLASSHAPHLLGFVKIVSWKRLERDLEPAELPTVPAAWPEGETLAFLIDFLRPDGSVEFRVYYQDAAAHPGKGIVPALAPPDDARVDVAILCVAGFDQVPGNPEGILANVKPRLVVGGHWEDFFLRSPDREPRAVWGTSVQSFAERAHRVARVPVYLAAPGQRLRVPIAPR